ncbi:phosphatidate phosphatase LPIN3 isoform X2 [Daphnia magna]|uniref:phosphatidate phosphatase LPIN3 isoform X2 n=1 Tax=Daphnia magna TaxID=35525 RepID=UPI001E1BC706|nr:phosphatidate phosphatase LPIN3 isoform X2 [Daphnia magna]
MEYLWSITRNVRELYNGINGATLTGAIDIVIVQQEDGTFLSSPFHVRFGKLGVLRSREKVVDIEINGNPVDIHMKLGESGEAFFVSESPMVSLDGQALPPHMATSPIPPSLIEENKLRGNNLPEIVHEHTDDTLMGKRDEGMLAKTSDDIILGEDSSQGKFETVGVEAVERAFKPIDPDQDTEADSLMQDEFVEMTEEERKRWKKKNRRRRSQLRKRMQREATKTSSESGTEPYPCEMEPELEIPLAVSSSLKDRTQVKPGHRKSHSLSGIQFKGDLAPPVENPVDDWVRGGTISRSISHGFHFFSDTEMEIRSPDGSRPPTPLHSDTEYEVGHMRPKASELDDPSRNCPQQSWRWGELPSPPVHNRPSPPKPVSKSPPHDVSPSNRDGETGAVAMINNEGTSDGTDNKARQSQSTAEAEAQRSMLSHMFSFMRQTKKMRHQGIAAGGGIYLDDLNVDALDPELAALYITQNSFRHGLADSTVSRLRDEDTESGKGASLPQSPHSLSTGAAIRGSTGPRSVDSDFEDSRPDYRSLPDVALSLCGHFGDQIDPPDELFLQSLVTYDDFIENPRLIENPDLLVRIGNKYYTWQAACPIVMSWVLYQRFLPQSSVDAIVHEYMPKRKEKKTEPEAPVRKSSWFPWRRRTEKKEGDETGVNTASTVAHSDPASSSSGSAPKTTESVNNKPKSTNLSDRQPLADLATGTSSDNESNDSNQPDSGKKLPMERRPYYENTDIYCKTLRLTTEQIRHLNLREGPNEAVFSVTTAYQGTTRCKCHIYLWRYDDKVVISDIDGTITKSDVLGHILPIVGQDWAQSGVAQLFTKIKNNGYRILYLSARAIGQAHVTREYLRSVRQGDLSLPDGPLLLNPTSLLSAFHREVIEKKPEEFKISCLRDIQMLFPSHSNPFYAGYGNRVNDVWAYRAVGIPTSRIFTINPRGELKLELTQSFQSSYSKQSFIVDLVFPPFLHGAREVLEGSEFSEFTYWRQPVPDTPDETEAAKFITAYSDSNKQRRLGLTKIEH